MSIKQLINAIILIVFLAIFLSIWTYILAQVWAHDPASKTPLVIGAFPLGIAGTVGGAIAAATAAAIGFEVKTLRQSGNATMAAAVAAQSKPLLVSVIAYVVVGAAVLVTIGTHFTAPPEVIVTFGSTFIGWVIGGFQAILKE